MKNFEDLPVVFYGAGNYAEIIANELAEYSIFPKYWVDADTSKHHKYIGTTEIVSKEYIREKYESFYVCITTQEDKWDLIAKSLVEEKWVEYDYILNFKLYEKKYSCRFLEEELTFHSDVLFPCCMPQHKPKMQIDTSSSAEEIISGYLELKNSTLSKINSNENHFCKSCGFLKYQYWRNTKTLNFLHIIDEGICNFKCIYCVRKTIDGNMTQKTYCNYREILNELKKRELIDDNLWVDISNDEISIHPDRNELLDVFSNYNIMLFSNASVYRPEISKALLKRKKSHMIVSMDSGTKETFAKIKNRTSFDIVCGNLRKYANDGINLKLKYIFLPGYNETYEEVDAFFELCKSLKVAEICISRNNLDAWEKLDEYMIDLMRHLVDLARKEKIPFSFFDGINNDDLCRILE